MNWFRSPSNQNHSYGTQYGSWKILSVNNESAYREQLYLYLCLRIRAIVFKKELCATRQQASLGIYNKWKKNKHNNKSIFHSYNGDPTWSLTPC